MGIAYADLGEPRKAIEFHEQSLKISREIGDRRGEGNHLGNLGIAYYHLGELRKAIEYYELSLKISREIGDQMGEANRLGNMGIAYADLGEPRKAIEFHEQALNFSEIENLTRSEIDGVKQTAYSTWAFHCTGSTIKQKPSSWQKKALLLYSSK